MSTMFTVESKSMLAKLLAKEKLEIRHRDVKTARFNLQTRTLTVPVWKDMDGDLYDLLIGHEIGHALFTPMEGWHDSIIHAGSSELRKPAVQAAYKNFLNVVEDARIEKHLKRAYPGLRKPMVNGYKELLKRDFFGLSAVSNYNDLYLIDKLNLATKCGTMLGIRFTAEEVPFYNKILAVETWEETIQLANELFEYSKQEQLDGQLRLAKLAEHLKEAYREFGGDDEEADEGGVSEFDWSGGSFDGAPRDASAYGREDEDEDDDYGYEEDVDEGGEEDESEDSPFSKPENAWSNKSHVRGDSPEPQDEEEFDEDKPRPVAESGRGAAPQVGKEAGDFIPAASTDMSFRNAEQRLVETDKVDTIYVNIPTVNVKDAVAPASVVNEGLKKAFWHKRELGYELLAEFKKKNGDYISLLAKEFEMKKAAKQYAKAKISDSGDIDINKLASYRTEDDIFRKTITLYKGKSHGLVLILDKSGSMSAHIEGAMEQIMVMAFFCRKVNIPFAAYSFTDNSGRSARHDFPNRSHVTNNPLQPFSEGPNDLIMGECALREMFNSKMNAGDFTQAIMNHMMLVKSLTSWSDVGRAPDHETMGGTPLNEALIILRDVIRNFKATYRLDLVNAIVVHDGDSNGNASAFKEDYDPKAEYSSGSRYYFDIVRNRVTLIDTRDNLQVSVPRHGRGMTIALMKWLQMTANCGVFGFYITGKSRNDVRYALEKLYQNKDGIKMTYRGNSAEQLVLVDKLVENVVTDKFLESYTDGYTRFYFIPGSKGLKITEDVLPTIAQGRSWTPGRLLTAFKKVSKKRSVSRVLVTRFIGLIAAERV